MAKRLERGFVRIILNQVSIDGSEMFYDGPLMRYENAFDILSKYKECFDSNSILTIKFRRDKSNTQMLQQNLDWRYRE